MKKVYVQPYWPFVILILCCFSLLAVVKFLQFNNSIDKPISQSEFVLTIIRAIVIMVIASRCFMLTPKGIWVIWMFVPVRLIRWQDVTNAIYLHHWTGGKAYDKMTGQSIAVTRFPIMPFNPTFDAIEEFSKKRPKGSVFIYLTKRNRDRVVKAFREYYPGLAFQEGSELNLDDL